MFLLDKDYWEVKETNGKGRGIFAKKPIAACTIIGDYVGRLVHLKDVDFDKEKENLYLMYYSDTTGIHPNLKKTGIHLLNHSCSPNCWIFKFKGHTLVFALKNIKRGDELTISYLLPPRGLCKNCPHACHCEGKFCTGSMHLTERGYKKWQTFQDKEETEARYEIIKNENALKPLAVYPKSISKSYIEEIKSLEVT